jgi:hypothetical protein
MLLIMRRWGGGGDWPYSSFSLAKAYFVALRMHLNIEPPATGN